MDIQANLKQKLNGDVGKDVDALFEYYGDAISDYRLRKWKECILNGGWFVESLLSVLCTHLECYPTKKEKVDVDKMINKLSQIDDAVDRDLRLTIPRLCRFIYDIASNKGVRHHSTLYSSYQSDADLVVSSMSWILANLVSTVCGVDNEQSVHFVRSIVEKQYPFFETIENRTYVNMDVKNFTYTELLLLLLYESYPKRVSRAELVDRVMMQDRKFNKQSIRKSVERIMQFVDVNKNKLLLLRGTGIHEAEKIIDKHSA